MRVRDVWRKNRRRDTQKGPERDLQNTALHYITFIIEMQVQSEWTRRELVSKRRLGRVNRHIDILTMVLNEHD